MRLRYVALTANSALKCFRCTTFTWPIKSDCPFSHHPVLFFQNVLLLALCVIDLSRLLRMPRTLIHIYVNLCVSGTLTH